MHIDIHSVTSIELVREGRGSRTVRITSKDGVVVLALYGNTEAVAGLPRTPHFMNYDTPPVIPTAASNLNRSSVDVDHELAIIDEALGASA